MPKKTIYEDNPWSDVADYKIEDFKVIDDLLPPAHEMKKASVVVDGNQMLLVQLSPKDIEILQKMAERGGVSSPDLAASILHNFVENTLAI